MARTLVDVIDDLLVPPGKSFSLSDRSTDAKLGLKDKRSAAKAQAELTTRLADLQTRLSAEAKNGLLVVLQAMDAGGKDGTIHSVFTGVNPQGVRVTSFKAPAGREAAQDYLWRLHAQCPARGEIAIFNRSHYEDVVVVRVKALVAEERWRKRFHHIREFEKMLTDEGTMVVKVFLHISSDEQRVRQQERIDDPTKNWKFRPGDLEDRKHWDGFMEAYSEALAETSTEHSPWYVIPSDRNWVRNVAVSTVLVHWLERINPQYPPADSSIKGIIVQ